MKIVKFIFATLMMLMWNIAGFAQCHTGASGHDHSKSEASVSPAGQTLTGLKTESYKVSGNCGMCKSTIEKAASVKGVGEAKWDSETKVLTLAYDPALTTGDSVLKLIADAGYDNEKFTAKDETYNALPGCCKYARTQEKSNDIK